MFKKKASKGSSAATKATPTPQSTSSATEVKRAPSGVPSIISTDLVITGNLVSVGDIQVDGSVHGDISSDSLTIGESATVQGVVEADKVRVCGRLEGQIRARHVVLTGTSHVLGDIEHESLEMEAGAFLHGHCRREEFRRAEAVNGAAKSSKSKSDTGALDVTVAAETKEETAKA